MNVKEISSLLLSSIYGTDDIMNVVRYIENRRQFRIRKDKLEDYYKHLYDVLKENELLIYPIIFNCYKCQDYISKISVLIGIKKEKGNLKLKAKPVNIKFAMFYSLIHDLLLSVWKTQYIGTQHMKLSLSPIIADINQSFRNRYIVNYLYKTLDISKVKSFYDLLHFIKNVVNLELGKRICEFIDDLSGASSIIVSLIGETVFLPIHALICDGSFLVEKVPVLYNASLKKKYRIKSKSCLIIDQDLGFKEKMETEGAYIEEIIKKKGLYAHRVRDICSKCMYHIFNENKGLKLIHISSHGYMRSDGEYIDTFIECVDGIKSLPQLFDKAKFKCELLVLSACGVHFSNIKPNSLDDISSPVYKLINNVNSVLTTIGPVSINNTKKFMGTFYRAYIDTNSFGTAFSYACKDAISSGSLDWIFMYPVLLRL